MQLVLDQEVLCVTSPRVDLTKSYQSRITVRSYTALSHHSNYSRRSLASGSCLLRLTSEHLGRSSSVGFLGGEVVLGGEASSSRSLPACRTMPILTEGFHCSSRQCARNTEICTCDAKGPELVDLLRCSNRRSNKNGFSNEMGGRCTIR